MLAFVKMYIPTGDYCWEAWGAEDWADIYHRRGFSKSDRLAIWRRDRGRCHYCKKALGKKKHWVIDHMHPFYKGGATTFENAVLACQSCNLYKKSSDSLKPYLAVGLFFRKVSRSARYSKAWDDYGGSPFRIEYIA